MNQLADCHRECETILSKVYTIEGNSYVAAEKIMTELGKHLRADEIRTGKTTARFLVQEKRALYTRIVAYHDKKQIKSNQLDVGRLCTTIKGSRSVIQAFFNYENGKYKDHTLVVNIGNLQHDMAVFINKNEKNKYVFIHFDPNIKASSQIMNAFVKQFGKDNERYGYHSQDGNVQGNCTYLAWMEILNFMLKDENFPPNVELGQYCSREQTYLIKNEAEMAALTNRQNDREYDRKIRKRFKQTCN